MGKENITQVKYSRLVSGTQTYTIRAKEKEKENERLGTRDYPPTATSYNDQWVRVGSGPVHVIVRPLFSLLAVEKVE